jgi:lipid II:glycine glycyltransferase (peptidoglycan interpeptide bridge formation enzyme)
MNQERISWLNRNCPDGGFLQSEEWRAFKEHEGFHTEHFEGEGFHANAIEHSLPVVGKYWYVPRGPVFRQSACLPARQAFSGQQSAVDEELRMKNEELGKREWGKLLREAKRKGAGWIRVEPRDESELALFREWSKPYVLKEVLHDMQPREIFVMDISKSEDEILAGMKAKTRYNVRLAEKRSVEVFLDRDETSLREFLRMTRETAARNHIALHSEKHYADLLEFFPRETLELFVARCEGKMLAAILVVFFGDTATYLHGASSDDDRGLMAPYLLQFRAMQEAKRRGCTRYDLGGVDTTGTRSTLAGVTRFKRGFAESVKTVQYPGSYDRVLIPSRFYAYKLIALSKMFVIKAIRHLTKRY